MPVLISSLHNARVKNVIKLNKRRYRDVRRLTVVEGVREISLALKCGHVPEEVFICPSLVTGEEAVTVSDKLRQLVRHRQISLFEVTPAVFAKMAYRTQSGGILALVPYFVRSLYELSLCDSPILVVIEGGEKPGNLGAILRTADAAGADGVIISVPRAKRGTDIHNPNVIRASLGAVFSVSVVIAPTPEVIGWLKQQGIRTFAATPSGSELYTAVDLTGPVALVMGSEADGLGQDWLDAADHQLVIPMQGIVDSLNLSVATALLLYEAVRQRNDDRS